MVPDGKIAHDLAQMAAAISHFGWYTREEFVASSANFALAHVHLNLLPKSRASNGRAPLASREWLHGERSDGFTHVEYDEDSQSVTITNDRLGMMPLFYARTKGALVFSTELKGVLAHTDVQFQLDERGLADLMAFGFLLGEKTLARGVRCLPGATRLRFNARSGELKQERIWDLRDHIGQPAAPQQLDRQFEEINDLFRQAVARRSGDVPLAISLSGGYDSRTIISAIDHTRTPVQTLTLDVPGGADQCLAEQISRLTNGLGNHHFIQNSGEFFARWPQYLHEMVWLTDGMYYDEACVMMPTLDSYRAMRAAAVLRGHGGELARMHEAYELRCNRHVMACRGQKALVDELFRRMNFGLKEADLDRLFVPELAWSMRGAARASLDEAFADIDSSWHVVDQVTCLYVWEYLRRQCVPSLAQLRSRVEVRMPFLDDDYMAAILRLPPPMRITSRVHRHILSRNNPALLKIRNANTMGLAGASDLSQRFSRAVHGLMHRYLGYQRYRHYVDVSGWIKGPLCEPLSGVLRNPQIRDRGLLRTAELSTFVQNHLKGLSDHPAALLLLSYFDTWHRQVVNGKVGCSNSPGPEVRATLQESLAKAVCAPTPEA
jgi:asparagine synthase (glutamine-hydrolysing)